MGVGGLQRLFFLFHKSIISWGTFTSFQRLSHPSSVGIESVQLMDYVACALGYSWAPRVHKYCNTLHELWPVLISSTTTKSDFLFSEHLRTPPPSHITSQRGAPPSLKPLGGAHTSFGLNTYVNRGNWFYWNNHRNIWWVFLGKVIIIKKNFF